MHVMAAMEIPGLVDVGSTVLFFGTSSVGTSFTRPTIVGVSLALISAAAADSTTLDILLVIDLFFSE